MDKIIWHRIFESDGGFFGVMIKYTVKHADFGPHWMDFVAKRIRAIGDSDIPLYDNNLPRPANSYTENFEDGEVFIDGYIKWDHCSQFNMSEHFCEEEQVRNIHATIDHILETTKKELIWD